MTRSTRPPTSPKSRLGKLLRRRDGSAIIAFALLAIPLVVAVGMAVDFGRVYVGTKTLQGVADAAALAGATVFTDSTMQSKASSTASAYFAHGILTLPPRMVVGTPTITTVAAPTCTTGAAETVTVTASATISTTLMSVVTPAVPVTVTATAVYPLTVFTLDVSKFDFSAEAGDLDKMYWYVVPDDSPHPDPNDMNVIISNVTPTNPKSITACVSAGARIGFAFSDSPSGKSWYLPGNSYGGTYGHTYYYYSTVFPPSFEAYNNWNYDSALQIVDVNSDGTYPAPKNGLKTKLAPQTGSSSSPVAGYGYFNANAEPLGSYATNGWVTCSGLAGKAIHIYWNDMGANDVDPPTYPQIYDDFNYTDGEINFQCDSSQTHAVYLQK